MHDNLYAYIVQLSQATRENAYIELGISPRGSIACTKMAKAWAFMQGREYVMPQDIAEVFPDIAKHRLLLNFPGQCRPACTPQGSLYFSVKPLSFKQVPTQKEARYAV